MIANNTPLVSVLMTAYNREKYIAEAIESVLGSTYKNWELIVLDDNSKDKTISIARDYENQDKRIKVYQNNVNLGQFKNRNKIVDYSQGKYLKYLDSDDKIYPYGLEQLVFYMEQFPDAGYGLCSIEQDELEMYPLILTPEETYHRHFVQNKRVFHKAPLSSIIKKDVFVKNGGFPHEAVSGDFAMWCNLSQNENVVLMHHGIVWYRNHEEQEMQKTRDSVKVEFEYFKVEEYFLTHIDNPMSNDDKLKAIKENNQKQHKFIRWKMRTIGIKSGIDLYKYKKQKFSLIQAS